MADDTSNRGFGKMIKEDPDRQKEIASEGGKASGGKFKAGDERTREAGRKGGANS